MPICSLSHPEMGSYICVFNAEFLFMAVQINGLLLSQRRLPTYTHTHPCGVGRYSPSLGPRRGQACRPLPRARACLVGPSVSWWAASLCDSCRKPPVLGLPRQRNHIPLAWGFTSRSAIITFGGALETLGSLTLGSETGSQKSFNELHWMSSSPFVCLGVIEQALPTVGTFIYFFHHPGIFSSLKKQKEKKTTSLCHVILTLS